MFFLALQNYLLVGDRDYSSYQGSSEKIRSSYIRRTDGLLV